ncbi:MRPL47 [Lepeophtheirus salmonis]|uniref:Large ribosomal subunit protein uL29m n=1 Tax=Lepeophtheirus salmonis TaxID=72036 RepID=A0A7R8CXT5_LEPSM|nr:MRPL47 [Lepeophtheirus salmonis]CAF2935053.1 MRPL47 [Lepeophtheirus salmonis]
MANLGRLSRLSRVIISAPKLTRTCFASLQSIKTNENGEKLYQFLDEPKNWGQDRVVVGRSWTKDELRLKNNEDLHKLWYVFLKERNMLLSMEYEYKEEYERLPNPERIDKVDDSMENLEEVVRERNRAYWELEVGETGERERIKRIGSFGIEVEYNPIEHNLPYEVNEEYKNTLRLKYSCNYGPEVTEFLEHYHEVLVKKESKKKHREMRICLETLRRYPNVEDHVLQEKFPLIDIELIKRWNKNQGPS